MTAMTDTIKYLRLFESYERLGCEYEELQEQVEVLQEELQDAIGAFQTVINGIDYREAERILEEHPEMREFL